MIKRPEPKFYNDARKYCPGCKRVRSMAQYASREDTFCKQCVLRGLDKAEAAPADRAYKPAKTI